MRRMIQAAQGRHPVDLCLRRCRLVNVFSGGIEMVNLAVQDGLIAGWGDHPYDAHLTLDVEGLYVCPGFIDGHIHIESTLLSPQAFAAAVVPHGTAAVAADPHEIANVLGLDGVRYVLEATAHLPLDVYLNLPGCVPATPLETSGAELRASDLHSLLPHERILGLAEMMNFPGVLDAAPEILDKLLLFQGMNRDGHAPQLSGLALNAYCAAGIGSDHECTSLEEAREKLAKGMTIMIREGSQAQDLEALLPLVDHHTWPRCMLVSDDRHPDDLLRDGHMDAIVNRAMALGMEPVRAIALATWTAARYFKLPRQGALAPGYQADFSLSPTLNPWTPVRVFKRGVEVAREGKLLAGSFGQGAPVGAPPSPMRLARLCIEDLRVPEQPGHLRVIGVQEGTLLTRSLRLPPKIENGLAVSDPGRDLLKVAVYNRYVPGQPPAVGFVQGIGLKQGAIATTVAHDSHNLIVVGVSDADMLHLVETLKSCNGGMAIGALGNTMELLPLPVAGLMSEEPVERVAQKLDRLKAQALAWGSLLHNPFMALSFLSLPVIPELKLTDLGLVDVSRFSFVALFEPV